MARTTRSSERKTYLRCTSPGKIPLPGSPTLPVDAPTKASDPIIPLGDLLILMGPWFEDLDKWVQREWAKHHWNFEATKQAMADAWIRDRKTRRRRSR